MGVQVIHRGQDCRKLRFMKHAKLRRNMFPVRYEMKIYVTQKKPDIGDFSQVTRAEFFYAKI
jgi:hypothetical protein